MSIYMGFDVGPGAGELVAIVIAPGSEAAWNEHPTGVVSFSLEIDMFREVRLAGWGYLWRGQM